MTRRRRPSRDGSPACLSACPIVVDLRLAGIERLLAIRRMRNPPGREKFLWCLTRGEGNGSRNRRRTGGHGSFEEARSEINRVDHERDSVLSEPATPALPARAEKRCG